MEVLDQIYGTGGLLVRLWGLARLDAFKDKYREFMRLEAKATIMQKYAMVVPGLPQTEDFAREALALADKSCCVATLRRMSGSSSTNRPCGGRRTTPSPGMTSCNGSQMPPTSRT
ncbi:hypothetical protein [Streptomyces sp. NPDC048611]|uniref:hypothetical protein n=1 Tax=Streptomyces sp. NPDC048611 TaxID=3155635 RepID=UPI003430570F